MNFNKADFEFSAGEIKQMPKSDLPEIVFSGKSNVGKSSLINKLLNRKSLARVSASPGKTATINSYMVDTCRFIDLPGYGYAKVSHNEKMKWAKLIESYFNSDRQIKLIVQIIDIRHEPSAQDFDMINYLIERDLPFMCALTKIDKLNKTETAKQLAYFDNLLTPNEIPYIGVSSVKGTGIDELKGIISSYAEGN